MQINHLKCLADAQNAGLDLFVVTPLKSHYLHKPRLSLYTWARS